ncbi:MAG: Asp23/Gls24 family envelope stress response protein, partial [Oscillospiraceae bacterium]
QPSGSLRISQDVIATIADYAASEIGGVSPVNNVSSAISKIIGGKKIMKVTSIDLNDDVAVIDMFLNLKYGTKIHEVAEDIQSSVKEAVQTMTGITVSKVNLHIDGITFEEKDLAK